LKTKERKKAKIGANFSLGRSSYSAILEGQRSRVLGAR